MSRRFGRNQKRAMRQAVAEAQAREDGLQRTLRVERELSREAREALTYITHSLRRLNEYTTMLPPQAMHVGRVEQFRRMEVREITDFRAYTADRMYDPEAARIVDLVHVARRIECDPRDDRHHIHLFLEGTDSRGEREWRYAIDRKAFELRGVHPAVLRDIAQRLATDLVLAFQRSIRPRA